MRNKKERLNDAIMYLKTNGFIRTQRDIAARMGASEANISKAIKGVEKNLTDKFLSRFNNTFDNIFSIKWLLTGEGEMLSSEIQQNEDTILESIYNNVLESDMEEKNAVLASAKEALQTAIELNKGTRELISNVIAMNNTIAQNNSDIRDMLQKLFDKESHQMERSQEYLSKSQENITSLRSDLRSILEQINNKIDEQTEQTEKLYIEGREQVISECRTFKLNGYEIHKAE